MNDKRTLTMFAIHCMEENKRYPIIKYSGRFRRSWQIGGLIVEVTNKIPFIYRTSRYRWFNLGRKHKHWTIFFIWIGRWHINFRTPSMAD